jgi:hypothetical protein
MLLYCAIIPNIGRYHEYKTFRGVSDCVPGGLEVRDGRITVPGGTGLGLDLRFVGAGDTQTIFTLKKQGAGHTHVNPDYTAVAPAP